MPFSTKRHLRLEPKGSHMVSAGDDRGDEPLVFYVFGDHCSETPGRRTISTDAARAALRYFVESRGLSPHVEWEPV